MRQLAQMRPLRSGAGGSAVRMAGGGLLGALPVMIASGAVAWWRPLQAFSTYGAVLHLVGVPLGPLQLALGGALTGIAAAIAGAIAAKFFADRRPTAAPAAKGAHSGARQSGTRESRARQEAGSDDGDLPERPFGPPPPPARVRLALPPEQPASPEASADEVTPANQADDATSGDRDATDPSA